MRKGGRQMNKKIDTIGVKRGRKIRKTLFQNVFDE